MQYEIPDPKLNPIASIVIYYKVLSGHEYNDKLWDRVHFGRCAKAAKELLEVCQNFEIAKRCLEDLSKKFIDISCDWTLETILKHAHSWKLRRGKNDGKSKQRFYDALAKSRSDNASPSQGEITTGGSIVDALGIIQFVRSESGAEDRRGDFDNGGPGERIPPAGVEKKETGGFEGSEGVVGL